MNSRLRALLGVITAALLLSGCGLFGDADEDGSPESPTDVAPETVAIEGNNRSFNIDPTTITFAASGEPSAASLDQLGNIVGNLGVDATTGTNAGIEHDGSAFRVVPSVPGQEPDLTALAQALVDATADSRRVQVPFAPVDAAVTDAQAQEYADELNERLGDGVEVAIGGQKDVLSSSILGPATKVSWNRAESDWAVAVDFAEIERALASLFPNVGAEGGEASFTIEPGETEDDPSTVVIVPGPSKTICCDEASVRRIERTLTSELQTASLLFKNVDGERGVAWAEGLGVTEVVGSFSTRYTPGQNRNINIQKIAELTQGVIIEPGETFSLNEFVGQRTRAKGFVPAGTIVNGHLVDSVGGGISQYATTIFNASFFAGLEFERYQSHSIYFSRYPYGREATISWPAPQLEIHNPTPHGILIWPTTTDNSITVDLYSTKWADVEQTGQREGRVGVACTRVTTERTRTFLDGSTDVDTVVAQYRKEGIACDGTETINPDDPTTTTTTIDPDATTTTDPDATTTTDPNAPTTTEDPDTTTTTSTTVVAPTTSDPDATTTTTTTTTSTTVAPESSTDPPVSSDP